MLSPGAEFDQPSVWRDLGLESMRLYPSFVEELRAETGIDKTFECSTRKTASWIPRRCCVLCTARASRARCGSFGNKYGKCEPRDYTAVVIAAGAWSGKFA